MQNVTVDLIKKNTLQGCRMRQYWKLSKSEKIWSSKCIFWTFNIRWQKGKVWAFTKKITQTVNKYYNSAIYHVFNLNFFPSNVRKSWAFAGHKTSRLQDLQRGGRGCLHLLTALCQVPVQIFALKPLLNFSR